MLYRAAAEAYPDRAAFAYPTSRTTFQPVTYRELYENGLNLATALIELGLAAREHAAILADNRIEWILADFGILLAGAADVPRGADITDQEIKYILSHSDARIVFVENKRMLQAVTRARGAVEGIEHIVVMDPKLEAGEGYHRIYDLVARGATLRAEGDRRAEARIERVKPSDVFTLIYTSGTTGLPKGVQLTHANMISQVKNVPVGPSPEDRMLSILPIWHSYERVFEMVALVHGSCTYYTSIRRIADDLTQVKPTLMASAPRLWENLYQRVFHRIKTAHPIRKMLFAAAMWSSRHWVESLTFLKKRELDIKGTSQKAQPGRAIKEALRCAAVTPLYVMLNAVVLEKLRQIVGGSFRGTISGGGALPPHVDQFFNFIGVPVLEGYGMTETSPVIAVRNFDEEVLGTVGPALPETEVRIMDLDNQRVLYPDASVPGGGRGKTGELHVRGPQVMKGYYKNKQATAEVLDENGWLNTGDLAMMTYNDCLKIVGRSKETIVLLNGENIQPTPIEAKLCESPLIEQAMVIGQDERHLGALLVVNHDNLAAEGVATQEVDALQHDAKAQKALKRDIGMLVSKETGFKAFETIHTWRIVSKAFEVGDEMTATFKLKRHVIGQRYRELIDEVFHHSREKGK